MSDRYSNFSREELVRLLERRDAGQRYGLIWEREGIDPDRAVNDDFVVLDLDRKLSTPLNGNGGWQNLVIEGDNWDALRALRLTHAGRIKCTIIDPPYNTGAKDFAYNDSYVGKDDRFRHSLWLEFLYKRLLLARDLMSEDGVILVCINDENRARLDLLMEQIFPGMRVGSFVWKTRMGSNDTKGAFLSADHEHVLIYACPNFRFGGIAKTFSMYNNPDDDPKGPWRVSDLTGPKDRFERPNSFYPLHDPTTGIWYPCNPIRVWAYASRARIKPGQKLQSKPMEEWIKEGRVVFPANSRVETWTSREALIYAIETGDVPRSGSGAPLLRADLPNLDEWIGRPCGWGVPAFKRYKSELRNVTQPLSSWIRVSSDRSQDPETGTVQIETAFSDEGAKQLQSIFQEKAFNYAKPFSLIRNLLSQTCETGDTILDFFAGSGTTANAVLALNAEDDGDRRFIMVSNSEATREEPNKNLCRDVCATRIRRVIDGYSDVPGLGGDFAYLRARRIEQEDVLFDLDAVSVWTLILLRQGRPLVPYDSAAAVQISLPHPDDAAAETLAFVPVISDAAIDALASLTGTIIIFTPAKAALMDRFYRPGLAVEDVPDRFLAEFRQNVVGL